ncbi:MAG TPA: SPOR domain-containing protein [Gammaproteobacteria bacterium]|jgi:DedD protein|nr:SPOR domain-containing protein [Gammaproteobacteria bacterium]
MDKKRTQRILGILVIIALVIILFPLLTGKSEQPSGDTTALKTPQFPEPPPPPSAMAAEDSPQDIATPPIVTSDAPGTVSDDEGVNASQELSQAAQSPAPENSSTEDAAPAISMDMNNRPNTEISALQPGTLNAAMPEAAPAVKIIDEPVKVIEKPISSQTKAVLSDKKRVAQPTKAVHKTEKDLAHLNAKAWVVQMGSFKDKSNARHLADTLRSAGYKAFTHDVKSHNGSVRTRVYIGPEYKQTAAVSLSTKVEQEMMLHGIIVTYHPLSM